MRGKINILLCFIRSGEKCRQCDREGITDEYSIIQGDQVCGYPSFLYPQKLSLWVYMSHCGSSSVCLSMGL